MALDNQIIICPKKPTSNRFLRNETYSKKIRLTKSRTLYYANTVMTLRLILPGDYFISYLFSVINDSIFILMMLVESGILLKNHVVIYATVSFRNLRQL